MTEAKPLLIGVVRLGQIIAKHPPHPLWPSTDGGSIPCDVCDLIAGLREIEADRDGYRTLAEQHERVIGQQQEYMDTVKARMRGITVAEGLVRQRDVLRVALRQYVRTGGHHENCKLTVDTDGKVLHECTCGYQLACDALDEQKGQG